MQQSNHLQLSSSDQTTGHLALRWYGWLRSGTVTNLDVDDGNRLLRFVVVTHDAVHCLGYEFKYQVEVHFVFLLTGRIEEEFESHNILMFDFPHYLQFAVLETLVLQHFLYGYRVAVYQSCLIYDAERSISDHLRIRVSNLLRSIWTVTGRRNHRRHTTRTVLTC
jgi:hypothetical protein